MVSGVVLGIEEVNPRLIFCTFRVWTAFGKMLTTYCSHPAYKAFLELCFLVIVVLMHLATACNFRDGVAFEYRSSVDACPCLSYNIVYLCAYFSVYLRVGLCVLLGWKHEVTARTEVYIQTDSISPRDDHIGGEVVHGDKDDVNLRCNSICLYNNIFVPSSLSCNNFP